MKIRAGAAFHHRNPATAPSIAAATIGGVERGVGVDRVARRRAARAAHGWRNCQNAMNTYAESTSVDEPAASPSSPSVRFTAFEDAVRITNAHT